MEHLVAVPFGAMAVRGLGKAGPLNNDGGVYVIELQMREQTEN